MAGPWLFYDSVRALNSVPGLNRDIYAVQADGSSLRRITTTAATEREPAVSPDGKTLAYSSDVKGSFQIYLMPLPTGPERQLTHDPQGAQQPAWSPDGLRLAYHNDGGVWVIGADGQGTTSVVGMDGRTPQNEYPVFAPSGRALIFDRFNQIHQVDLITGLETSIVQNTTTTIEHPAVSPGWRTPIAFDTFCFSDKALSVWVAPIAANTFTCMGGTRITAAGGSKARAPSFSPTGLIAFEHGDANPHIAVVAPGSDAKDVTTGTDDRNPSWSPVGLVLP